jgi:hypothetical protein
MTFAELLPILRSRSIRLWVEEGQVRNGAPKGPLTPGLRAALAAHRETVDLVQVAPGVKLEVVDHGGLGPPLPLRPEPRAARAEPTRDPHR